MKAIILAAGKGRRLKKTFDKPKCLIRLSNGETILERICRILRKNGIEKIIVVTGYKKQLIDQEQIKNIKTVFFPKFSKTNNLQTLLSVKKFINGEFLCLFGDIVFDENIIKDLISIKKRHILLAVRKKKILQDTMRVRVKKKKISEIGNQVTVNQADGNFIGIAKFTSNGSKILKKYLIKHKKNLKDYYTEVFNSIIKDNFAKISYFDIKNKFWKEVDSPKDFNILKKVKKLN